MTRNPLADVQREKKGAETFGKYEYQYHWALLRLLDEHTQENEYAIFVECHEDVVISNSLNGGSAEFEFNQIKEKSGSPYTVNSLVKINSGEKNSVLGKLINSYQGKTFKELISTVNLVSTSGFNKGMVKDGLDLEIITVEDLSLKSLAKFKKSIFEELNLEECPTNIRFILPKLPAGGKKQHIIGCLSLLITSLYPHSQCDAAMIYRLLIDELHAKGEVKHDYIEWDEFLKNKALTSRTVQKTIEAHTSIKGLEEFKMDVAEFLSEISETYLHRKSLKKAIEDYYFRKLSNRTSFNVKFEAAVVELCSGLKHLDVNDLLENIEQQLDDELKKQLQNSFDLKAAIISEIVTGDL